MVLYDEDCVMYDILFKLGSHEVYEVRRGYRGMEGIVLETSH